MIVLKPSDISIAESTFATKNQTLKTQGSIRKRAPIDLEQQNELTSPITHKVRRKSRETNIIAFDQDECKYKISQKTTFSADKNGISPEKHYELAR